MKVLFVDDEPRVLESLERAFFDLDLDWDISRATSGREALEVLARGAMDVVVTDMRMPGMDGSALLEAVKNEMPGAARIVLSGQTDEASTMRVMRLAHQFLSKPCSTEHLVNAIRRAAALQSALLDPELRRCICGIEALPPAPAVYQELTALLENEEVSVDAIAEVVRSDPAIASHVLQIANSSFFRSGKEISAIGAAVARLGLRLVRGIALSTTAFAMARALGPADRARISALQRRSACIASTARRLSLAGQELAFTAGLLCDLGELVMLQRTRAPEDRALLRQADHAMVGAVVLDLWGIPASVAQAVAAHHDPRRGEDGFDAADAVFLAVRLVEGAPIDDAYVKRHRLEAALAECRASLGSECGSWG